MIVELAGTHCSGKTTLCRFLEELGACKCVRTVTWHCTLLDGRDRQECFMLAIMDAYVRAQLHAKRHRCVVVDNSLLSVAAYNALYGILYKHIIEAWKWFREKIGLETVVVVADPETLRARCEKRQRKNWEWEAMTTASIQNKILEVIRQL